ncbi:hypothetical protein [Jannaschia ovalis]|uniref:Uncharacterized protein n=1 Tax=Jannaschia ovalis TaxID=3038773 RepID=A0ABY8LCP3_9RHOB|nr:hypothetical protein [Jannaschia sp. GRR-S6-38]WGH77825.1 hypothetical protein P8627_12385 [Jannaschia sp. GRR-S6-38]
MYNPIDVTAMVFYGLVCMVLAGYVPATQRRGTRLAIGAGVGMVAAVLLNLLRAPLGI